MNKTHAQVDDQFEDFASVSSWNRLASWVRAQPVWSQGHAPIALLLGVHFLVLAFFFEPAISTPDANGYFAQARLIADEGRTDIAVESPSQYVGDHWMPVGEGHYYGQYPPGLPALLALVYRPLGPSASLWVIPLMGTLSLLALFLVARDWVGGVSGELCGPLDGCNDIVFDAVR